MKTFFTLLLVIVGCSVSGYSQSLQEFNALADKNDTLAQLSLITKWEKKGKNDPDFYVAAFNYYANRARKEVVSLQQNAPNGETLQLTDSDGNAAGYMGNSVVYSADETANAFKYINTGISKFPNRLDLRFGKTYLLGQTGDYEGFTKEIVAAIDYSDKIKNKWVWIGAKPLEDSKAFMLGSIQSYINQIYETEDDSLLENMLQISNRVLKYYPDEVIFLSDASIVHMLRNEPDKALESLLKAEKITPDDYIVLGNIAHAYVMKNDTANAIKYYELTIKYGDNDTREFSQQKIEELKKK